MVAPRRGHPAVCDITSMGILNCALPGFISYPRVGSHPINCALELYFDRPRIFEPIMPGMGNRGKQISFLSPSRTDYLWVHTHDAGLKCSYSDKIYMWRDPVDTMFSHAWADGRRDEIVLSFCSRYRAHLQRHIIDVPARTILTYEAFLANPIAELSRAILHFRANVEIDLDKATAALHEVSKDALATKGSEIAGMKGHYDGSNLSSEYADRRLAFRAAWSEQIYGMFRNGPLAAYVLPAQRKCSVR